MYAKQGKTDYVSYATIVQSFASKKPGVKNAGDVRSKISSAKSECRNINLAGVYVALIESYNAMLNNH